MKRRYSLAVFLLLALSLVRVQASFAQASYSCRDIGTLGGVISANGVSNQGEVVGQSVPANDNRYHAFYWSPSTGMLDISGGNESYAYGLNNLGDVVGRGTGSIPTVFLWNAVTRAMTDLNSLPYTSVNYPANATIIRLTDAVKINDNRVVVGRALVSINGVTGGRAYMFDLNFSTLTDLGVLPGQTDAFGKALNNLASPQVVGTSGNAGFLCSPGAGITPLPVTNPRAINDAGGVAAQIHSSYDHPAYWSVSTGTIDIGTFGGNVGNSWGINNHGLLVGSADIVTKGSSAPRAFRWFAGSAPSAKQNLNSLTSSLGKWFLISAQSVSDNGNIACNATTSATGTQGTHVFLLMPN